MRHLFDYFCILSGWARVIFLVSSFHLSYFLKFRKRAYHFNQKSSHKATDIIHLQPSPVKRKLTFLIYRNSDH